MTIIKSWHLCVGGSVLSLFYCVCAFLHFASGKPLLADQQTYIELLVLNTLSDLSNASIRMSIGETQLGAKEHFKNFVFATTAMSLFTSTAKGIEVGDFAIGDDERLTCIRGNVYIDVIGDEGISIGALAKEIDQQILEIINKK